MKVSGFGFRVSGFLIIVVVMCSCTAVTREGAVALGGKGAARGEGWAVVWDNEASFREGAMLATAAVGAWANVASTKAAEATTRALDANRSAEAINASNNAVKTVEIGAGVTKATTVNPNVIPK